MHFSAITKNAAVNMGVQVFESQPSIVLGVYQEAEGLLAQSEDHEMLGLRVVSSSPTLGMEII